MWSKILLYLLEIDDRMVGMSINGNQKESPMNGSSQDFD